MLRAWRASAPEKLQEITLGRRFAPAPDGGKRTVADTTIRAGETRRLGLPLANSAAASAEPISLELRLVYTIDEFPFKGRELAEPTFATMIARELDWRATPRCARAPVTSAAAAERARPGRVGGAAPRPAPDDVGGWQTHQPTLARPSSPCTGRRRLPPQAVAERAVRDVAGPPAGASRPRDRPRWLVVGIL